MRRVEIDELPDGLVLRSDLRHADEDLHLAALAGLAGHLGIELDLAKAVHARKPDDPRFPELARLMDAASTGWSRWTAWFLDRVLEAVRGPELDTSGLVRAMTRYRVGVPIAFAGRPVLGDEPEPRGPDAPADALGALVPVRAPIVEALDAGAALDPTAPYPVVTAVAGAASSPVPRSAAHDAARRWVSERAGSYIRIPADGVTRDVERVLNDDEYRRVRQALGSAVVHGERGLHESLVEATTGTRLRNDVDRIVRTEIAEAHAHGAYVALKARAAGRGDHDPLVYRIPRPDCCVACRSVWGPTDHPHVYRLSVLEANDLAGGNRGRRPSEYVPVTGLIHPNCVCGPLLLWRPEIRSKVEAAAAELKRMFG